MTDRYLDKTEVVSVIYYSDNKQATPHYTYVNIQTPSLTILQSGNSFITHLFLSFSTERKSDESRDRLEVCCMVIVLDNDMAVVMWRCPSVCHSRHSTYSTLSIQPTDQHQLSTLHHQQNTARIQSVTTKLIRGTMLLCVGVGVQL